MVTNVISLDDYISSTYAKILLEYTALFLKLRKSHKKYRLFNVH